MCVWAKQRAAVTQHGKGNLIHVHKAKQMEIQFIQNPCGQKAGTNLEKGGEDPGVTLTDKLCLVLCNFSVLHEVSPDEDSQWPSQMTTTNTVLQRRCLVLPQITLCHKSTLVYKTNKTGKCNPSQQEILRCIKGSRLSWRDGSYIISLNSRQNITQRLHTTGKGK